MVGIVCIEQKNSKSAPCIFNGIPIIAGRKIKSRFNYEISILLIAEYFLKNEFNIVLVVIISTYVSSNN